jgi:hypothetical protein
MAAVIHGRQGAQNVAAVTPNDTTDLAYQTTALFVGTGGAVAVIDGSGNTTTLGNVPSGTTVPIYVTRVKATGTTASNIVAIW